MFAEYAPSAKEMTLPKLSSSDEIWTLSPALRDLEAGAYYASVSLPWTFNRMMYNTSSNGQQYRALNIAKGIVGQEMLRREMRRAGIPAETQRKSYRDEDLFDFDIRINGLETKLDLKTVNYYTNYDSYGREPFSSDLLANHASYAGPDWRTFFPMLVPHTQINQPKQAYCFAIASSIDIRNDVLSDRADYALTAFPSGEHLAFLGSKMLCHRREEAESGFHLSVAYENPGLFRSSITVNVIGEWAGQGHRVALKLASGEVHEVGPFSCVASIQVDKQSYDQLYGTLSIEVCRNNFVQTVYNSRRRNINTPPKSPLTLTQSDFCNLFLPNDYTLYVIGWTSKEEFLEACRQYTGWVWPLDRVNRFHNQPWSQITDPDKRMLLRTGFDDAIQELPTLLNAGWLKTTGRGTGACCYVFPNVPRAGGVNETNLYILPGDLYNMDSLNE